MNKTRQWSMLTAFGVVVVLAAGWFLAVSPQRHHAAELRSQATQQQSANASLQAQVAQLEQQKKGLPAQQRLLAQFADRIPDNPALPTLIRQLSAAAEGAGVDLVSLAPSSPSPVTPAAPAAATAGATTAAVPAAALNQISLALNVKGTYFNIESFFASLEKLTRATMVTQWSLTPGAASGTAAASASSGSNAVAQDPPGTMSATMTAIVYESPKVVPTQVSPVAPAAPAK